MEGVTVEVSLACCQDLILLRMAFSSGVIDCRSISRVETWEDFAHLEGGAEVCSTSSRGGEAAVRFFRVLVFDACAKVSASWAR